MEDPDSTLEERQEENKTPRMEDFNLRGVLGAGLFAEVHLAEKRTGRDAGRDYAVKRFLFRRQLEKEAAERERHILARIAYAQQRNETNNNKGGAASNGGGSGGCFVVRLFYAFQPGPGAACLVTSLGCGTDLHDLLRQCPAGQGLGDDAARFYLAELAAALEFLHEAARVVHSDLKLENVLLDDTGHVLLCDFNLAYHLPDDRVVIVARDGTPTTMAPEVAAYEGYAFPADVWSYGMIAVQLSAGAGALGETHTTAGPRREHCAKGAPSTALAACSGPVRAFAASILRREPSQRPRAAHLKRLPFFKRVQWSALVRRRVKPPCCPFGNLPGARRDIGLKPAAAPDLFDEQLVDFDYVDASLLDGVS